jgi:hypothetical protein
MNFEAPELEKGAGEPSPAAQKAEGTPTKQDIHDFLAEFAAPKKEVDESPLMKDALLDRDERINHPELWKKELEKSKEKARTLTQSIPAIEALFKDSSDVMLSIKVRNDGRTLEASVLHGEVGHNAFDALQKFLDDCDEVRIASRFYGADIGCVRFAGLFSGASVYRTSPKKLFDLLKDALASAEEIG